MIRRTAGYLLVLLAAAYLYFMYNDTVISGILLFLILYLPVSALYLILAKGRIEAELERVPAMGETGRQIRAGAVVKNRSRMTGIRYELSLTVGNIYDKKRYCTAQPQEQAVTVAIALAEHLLGGDGAVRVHGGGFAGTIQAYVPRQKEIAFQQGMEAVLGQGCCHFLRIRPVGGAVLA